MPLKVLTIGLDVTFEEIEMLKEIQAFWNRDGVKFATWEEVAEKIVCLDFTDRVERFHGKLTK